MINRNKKTFTSTLGSKSRQTFESLSQRAGEEDVGQLALDVSFVLVVTLLTVDVFQVDGAPGVSHGGHRDDSGRRRSLNQIDQQICQQEVTWRTRKWLSYE